MVCVSDDLEAVSVRQFIKHIMELYSNNQHGFSQEFDVSMVFVVGACENVCVCALYMYPVLPVAQRHRWLWEKDLIKEESLIKITPLAGGIYAGMQGSLSLVHAHSKHHNPVWTHPKARTGSPEEDLLKDFDAYQYQRCSRYQFVTEVLCFTDIERQNLHGRLMSASLRLTGELIIMLLYKIYFRLHWCDNN